MNEVLELDRPIRSAMGWQWVSLALAVGVLIFAHGCHGPDEDQELLVRQARESIPWIGECLRPGACVGWIGNQAK
jgi:hypothetical protein